MGQTTQQAEDLRRTLERIAGRGYKAYKGIEGVYAFPGYLLRIDHVQGDPFAAPSAVRVMVAGEVAGFPAHLFSTPERRIGLEDFLLRVVSGEIRRCVKGNRGSGKSGLITIMRCGQEILPRTAVQVIGGCVEARFQVGLPAFGRSVAAQEAIAMLFEEVPKVVEGSLLYRSLDHGLLDDRAGLVDDQKALRKALGEMGLVAFVATGSILPRRTGINDEPMKGSRVIPFASPDSLEVAITLPHRGVVRGMGIPKGITLIVGGGYHGKSTLLEAISRGVYDHIERDGREFVMTDPDAVKIRAEDGRRVERVDISAFIDNLPFGQDTSAFSTEDASGSTSQAANIVEALEVGATALLLDEDTSATNFMIRDFRMQNLVAKEKEPITPFIDRVRGIYESLGVSTVLVMGGAGDYFEVADTIIMMDSYRALDVTENAHVIAREYPLNRVSEGNGVFPMPAPRVLLADGFDPYKRGRVKIQPRGTGALAFGDTTVLLNHVEQLVDEGQTRATGDLIHYMARKHLDGRTSLMDALASAMKEIEEQGLVLLSPFREQPEGTYALPRIHEVAAAVNRMRTLRVRTGGAE